MISPPPPLPTRQMSGPPPLPPRGKALMKAVVASSMLRGALAIPTARAVSPVTSDDEAAEEIAAVVVVPWVGHPLELGTPGGLPHADGARGEPLAPAATRFVGEQRLSTAGRSGSARQGAAEGHRLAWMGEGKEPDQDDDAAVGSEVEAWCATRGCWRPAIVVAKRRGKAKLQFLDHEGEEEPGLGAAFEGEIGMATGAAVEVLSLRSQQWRLCCVVATRREPDAVRVHYEGFSAGYDEWLAAPQWRARLRLRDPLSVAAGTNSFVRPHQGRQQAGARASSAYSPFGTGVGLRSYPHAIPRSARSATPASPAVTVASLFFGSRSSASAAVEAPPQPSPPTPPTPSAEAVMVARLRAQAARSVVEVRLRSLGLTDEQSPQCDAAALSADGGDPECGVQSAGRQAAVECSIATHRGKLAASRHCRPSVGGGGMVREPRRHSALREWRDSLISSSDSDSD